MEQNRASLRRWGPIAVVTLLVVATLVGAAAVEENPTGDDVLEGVEEKYGNSDTLVGSAQVTVENGTEERTAEVEFALSEENKSRITVHSENRTMVVGTNGSAGWAYEPTTGITRIYDNDTEQQRLQQKATDLRERYEQELEAEKEGTEKVGGRQAYVVETYSNNESVSERARLWVDTEDSTVLKAVVTGENGTATAVFDETNFGVNVHESTYEPPSEGGDLVQGAQRESFKSIEEASEETEVEIPDLRDEYPLERVLVASYRGEETVTSTYETDSGDVYLAVTTEDGFVRGDSGDDERKNGSGLGEKIDIGDRTGTYIDSNRGSVVYWQKRGGDRTVAVFTRGTRSTALGVAESVR